MREYHYFNRDYADPYDVLLSQAIGQGYVPETCLLGGVVIMDEVKEGRCPCWGCEGPREKCKGQPKRSANETAPR